MSLNSMHNANFIALDPVPYYCSIVEPVSKDLGKDLQTNLIKARGLRAL